MNKTSYSANSSTGVQPRQLTPNETHFSAILARMQAGGAAPTSEEINQAGDLADMLVNLSESLEMDGIPGINKTLQIMSGAKSETARRLNKLLAAVEAEKEQDEDDKTRIDQRGKKVFRVLTEDDVDLFPDPEWLISSILQTATVSLVFGDSNVGKTFFALYTSRCIARGQEWFGRNVKAGIVLYIYAEGKYGLKPRLQALRKHFSEGKTNNIHFIPFPVHLIHDRVTLIDTVTSLEAENGFKYTLVVIDTISNCSSGINQNDQAEVFQLLDTAHDVAREHDAHVMVIHHTNKQRTADGSQALKNHVDTQIELKKPEESSPVIVAHCEKQRDGAEKFKDILLELQVIDLGMNEKTLEPITSCVMVLSQSKLPASVKAEQEREAMLDLLKEHETLTQRKWMDLCSTELSISRKPFEYHLERLKHDKMVTWTPEIPKERQAIHYKAALTIEDILDNKNGDSND